MITATGLELRAGPRLLLGDATFRIAPGDRVGLVGRNGAGKTTLTRVLSGETPAGRRAGDPVRQTSATCRRTRAPATSRCWPATASCPPAAWTPSLRRMRDTEGEMASADPDTHERAMRRYAAARGGVPGRRGVRRRERGGVDRVQPGAARAGARPAAADPVRRSAPPGRAVPDPVLRSHRRDTPPAAGRADQPPRRRLDRLAARLPRDLQGRARGHQPRRRPARAAP